MKVIVRWLSNICAMAGVTLFAYEVVCDLRKVERGFDLWINCSLVLLLSLASLLRWLRELVVP